MTTWLILYYAVAYLLRVGMIPVVLRRQMAPGASLAWLGIVFLHPYIGVALYLLVGETRLKRRTIQHYQNVISRSRDRQSAGVLQQKPLLEPSYESMVLQAQKISGMPVLPGNSVRFLPSDQVFFDELVAEIDNAKSRVHLLYYIFATDATARRVVDALKRAKARGVTCRLIADALASRDLFGVSGLSGEIEKAGIELVAALPVAPWKRGFRRLDLRNHRKLAIIDGRIGFAGSHNVINADYGGRTGGPWLDLSARFTGPIVDELATVFREDWAFETGVELDDAPCESSDAGESGMTPVQIVPTGPSSPDATYRRVLLAAIQCARQRLTITTPYFVPDETTIVSMMMAADRGVEVNLLVPQTPDHFFTAAAGRAHYSKLMDSGVNIYFFQPCLLHAKTTTVDDAFSLFGSANLDVRSFNLNFELTCLLYGEVITRQLRSQQEAYLKDCKKLDPAEWCKRPAWKRYGDGAISLLSPLL